MASLNMRSALRSSEFSADRAINGQLLGKLPCVVRLAARRPSRYEPAIKAAPSSSRSSQSRGVIKKAFEGSQRAITR
jgi:hypothetical protein